MGVATVLRFRLVIGGGAYICHPLPILRFTLTLFTSPSPTLDGQGEGGGASLTVILVATSLFLPLAIATSPSGCAILCMAVGAMPIGKGTFCPRMVVEISRDDTSRRMQDCKRIL